VRACLRRKVGPNIDEQQDQHGHVVTMAATALRMTPEAMLSIPTFYKTRTSALLYCCLFAAKTFNYL